MPGTEQSLSSIAVQNKSSTENVYAFISFSYDPAVYDIKDVSGWEFVEDNGGQVVYSYSSGGSMTPVDINGSATFTGTLECVADNSTFQGLEDSDFKVDVIGYAISTSICSEGASAAWADYQNGGNQ